MFQTRMPAGRHALKDISVTTVKRVPFNRKTICRRKDRDLYVYCTLSHLVTRHYVSRNKRTCLPLQPDRYVR